MASTEFDMKELTKMVQDLREEFLTTAEILDKHYTNFNIAKISAGVGGVVGAGLAVGGAVAAPFTFGLSFVLSVVGVAIGLVASAISSGAMVARYVYEKIKLKDIQAKWEELREKCGKLMNMPKQASETTGTQLERVGVFLRNVCNAADAVVDTARTSLKSVALQAGVSGSRVAGKIVASSLFVLSVLSMGVSVWDIIAGSVEIHKKTGSPIGDTCRKLAKGLKELSQTLQEDTESGPVVP